MGHQHARDRCFSSRWMWEERCASLEKVGRGEAAHLALVYVGLLIDRASGSDRERPQGPRRLMPREVYCTYM